MIKCFLKQKIYSIFYTAEVSADFLERRKASVKLPGKTPIKSSTLIW